MGDCDFMFKGAKVRFFTELTASGSSKFSMFSTAIGSSSTPASGLLALAGDGSFISEAGVAGEGFPGWLASVGPAWGVSWL